LQNESMVRTFLTNSALSLKFKHVSGGKTQYIIDFKCMIKNNCASGAVHINRIVLSKTEQLNLAIKLNNWFWLRTCRE
jgi:hypothetical protein